MKLTRSANIIEVDVNGRKYSKVNYSVPEEIANCVTHGLPILFYIAGLIYMLTISFDARTYATSIITCLSAITVYTISTIYHAVQDTVKKYYWRKVDHSDVPFLVIGCSCAVCLLLSTHVYNYIALGVSFGIAFISVALSVTNVDKFNKKIAKAKLEADDKKAMELALIENLQRQDLNPLEEALGYQTLMNEYGLTQEEAAGRVGKSRPAVANALRLLGLCPEVQERVRKGELSAGHARAILQLKSEKKQQEAAQKIVALGLSVRQAELLCKNMSKEPVPQKKEVFAVDYVAECEKSLSKHLGRGVKIVNGKRKGRFELEFYGQEDLQNLLDALMKIQK